MRRGGRRRAPSPSPYLWSQWPVVTAATCSCAANCAASVGRVPAKTAPRTVPSALRIRNAFSFAPVIPASAPAPVAVPRPKNALTAEPPVGVQVHVLPVSVVVTVFAVVAPVSVSAVVAGAHTSVPCVPVRVTALEVSVVIVALNVPAPSVALPLAVPDAVADAAAKLVPVPVTFASRA